MAVAPIPPRVSADEYLNSGYHPDMEYVEGVPIDVWSTKSFIGRSHPLGETDCNPGTGLGDVMK